MAAATWQLPPELPPAVPDCVRAQVEHMLVNGAAAGLQISPVPGSLPPLLQPGPRRVDAPPFQLDFELCMQKLRCQVMLQRMGPRSWAPDFVFPEPAFRPLAAAVIDSSGESVRQNDELRAALRGWDSSDPAALLRAVLLVINSYRRFQFQQVAEAARRDERLQFELDTMAGEGLEVAMTDPHADGTRQAVLSVPLRGVNLAPLQPLLQPQPGLSAFAPAPPPPSGLQSHSMRQASGSPSSALSAVKMVRTPSMPGILATLGGRKASASLDTPPLQPGSAALSRVSAPPHLSTGPGSMLRVPSSRSLQQSPDGSAAAAAALAFAEAADDDSLSEGASQLEAAADADDLGAQLRLCVQFPVAATGNGSGAGPRTQLTLPPRLEALVGVAQLPAWTSGSCLLEYVPATVEALQAQVDAAAGAAALRRAFLVGLADAVGPPLDADGATFWGASFVMAQHGVSALVRIDLSPAFPQELPFVTLQSAEPPAQRRPFVLEVRDYPWSPRWAAAEMARRTYATLMEKLPEWQSGAVQAELGM